MRAARLLDVEGEGCVIGECVAGSVSVADVDGVTVLECTELDLVVVADFAAGDGAGVDGVEDASGALVEAVCRVPGLMEALIPRKDESHGSTEKVPRGASGAGDPDGGRSAA